MNAARPICYAMAWLAVGAMCLPAHALAAEEPARQSEAVAPTAMPISDVALGPGGLLTGRVLDEHLQPLIDADVAILADGKAVATTRSDANGVFAIAGLRGGIHQVVTPEASRFVRLWVDGTAPPRAARGAEIVGGPDIVRGQWGGHNSYIHRMAMWATNPFLVGGVIAAAVAVPVIIHNTDDDDPPQS